jgi:hypothetical protein
LISHLQTRGFSVFTTYRPLPSKRDKFDIQNA